MTVRRSWVVAIAAALVVSTGAPAAKAAVTAKEVESAIKLGIKYLKSTQRGDGSWTDVEPEKSRTGVTSLVTLALLTAGEPANSSTVARALEYLRNWSPDRLRSTYSVSLQTMVYAAAQPDIDKVRLTANVAWLERAQIKTGDRVHWPGSWSYTESKSERGDGSNTQYALLALNAAAEVGIPVKAEVWTLARGYWESGQRRDGGWPYTPDDHRPIGSMTTAGVSSLIITGLKRFQGQEFLDGARIENCGKGGFNPYLTKGIDWLARNFYVGQNYDVGQTWRFYYLYGLERAGRLSGQRFFGQHDWYREGAERLVHEQDKLSGYWQGEGFERNADVATSFALLFLAKGRAPVLINKLRHGPTGDWNNDPDDIRNLVNLVSRDWKNLVTWQVVDPNVASVKDLMQAPILFFNGHVVPEFSDTAKKALREYVEQGGFIFADACCGRSEFDKGFHALMKEIFPEPEYKLHPLAEDHAVWRSRYLLKPDIHPLWGIEHGCRTVVIYSPDDLSCYWNQSETSASNTAVIKAQRVGQNVVDYATGKELPADKLVDREVRDFRAEVPKRGALQIAKLKHAGDWNVAPLAVPNLMTSLRNQLGYDVVINHRELVPHDRNLVNFPLVYIHGRATVSFNKDDVETLRRHLNPGGGLLFADAACGSPAFDAAFRKFVAELVPDSPLVEIPHDDEIYSARIGYDLSDVQYSKSAGGGKNFPRLEGVKVKGRWAVIYSKYDIGCALERHQGLDCQGYTPESALRIASNIVIYSTLP